jgi:hypothetical protein
MSKSIIPDGINGLSDSLWSGTRGSCSKLVGIDYRSTPGVFKAHQKMSKDSGSTVTELCKNALDVSDGSRLWFSSESGKIWRESEDTYTLVHTTDTSNLSFYNDVQNNTDSTEDATALLTDDTSLTNDCLKLGQTFRFTADTDIDAVEFYLREIGTLNGGYDLKLTIYENNVNNGGEPNSTEVASVTKTIASGDIAGDRHAPVLFVFDKTYTITADNLYWFVLEVVDYADIDTGEAVSISMTEETEDQFAKYYITSWSSDFGGDFLRTRLKIKRSRDREVILDNLTGTGLNASVEIGTNVGQRTAEKFAQSFSLTEEKEVDTIVFKLDEATINGGYSLKVSIQTDDNNSPSGIEVVSGTKTIASGDIPTSDNEIAFTLDSTVTLTEDTMYWVIIEPTVLSDITQATPSSVSVLTAAGISGKAMAYRDLNSDSTHVLDLERGSSQSTAITNAAQTGLGITGNLTIEAEILLESTPPNDGDKYVIASKSRSDGNQRGYRFILNRTGANYFLELTISSNGSSETSKTVAYASPSSPSTQKQQVAVVYTASSGEADFYINGVKSGATQTGLPTSIFNNTSNFTVGADNYGASGVAANFFDGYINNVKVWNTARTASQILNNRGRDLIGNESGLAGYWKFNNNHEDTTSNNNDLTATNSPSFVARTEDKWRINTADGEDINASYNLKFALRLSTVDVSSYGEVKCLGAEEHLDYIYWATEKLLNRIPVSKITTANDWTDNNETGYGKFENGDTEFHPMILQNKQLYIGDGIDIAKIFEDGDFISTTEFQLVEPERIQTLVDFDIDILVGTRFTNKGRVLRWDGVTEGWSAQDEIEEEGINSFVKDDNYVYVQAGFYGRLYFYNGEKLEPYKRIPGTWNSSSNAIIYHKSTAFHLGVPVFGLSAKTGDPTLLGIYGFGSYGVGYDKTLSLDFPVPTAQFSSLYIGGILAKGADLYASYKTSTDVGIAKLNWSLKYESPYLETPTLIGQNERSNYSFIDGINVDYVELPSETDISIGIKKAYESSFATLNKETFPDLKQVKSRTTSTKIANLITRIDLTSNENDSPIVENISIDI